MRIIEVNQGHGPQRIVTYLSEQEMQQCGGLPPEAVIGLLDQGNELVVNSTFREFLHEAIGTLAPLDPGMQNSARAHGDGRLVYVDSRVPEDVQPIPDEDVLGWFQVRSGMLVNDSYVPNTAHRIHGIYGFTAVLAEFRDRMAEELIRRAKT